MIARMLSRIWKGVCLEERPVCRAAAWYLIGAPCAATFLLASSYAFALVSADVLLTERDAAAKADVIVVLGGQPKARGGRAAKLWLGGVAPRILVTGQGDCGDTRQVLIGKGVDPSAITLECRSRSTWENAEFSAPILKQMNVRRAVIVTSWFHSRRAMTCFSSMMPGIAWISVPAERTQTYLSLALHPDGFQVLKEYPKTLWYGLRLPILLAPDFYGPFGMKLGARQ